MVLTGGLKVKFCARDIWIDENGNELEIKETKYSRGIIIKEEVAKKEPSIATNFDNFWL